VYLYIKRNYLKLERRKRGINEMSKVLVTGGAGFIGSHLVDKLVEMGNEVVVLDNLEPQVHAKKPDYLNPKAQYLFEDIRDEAVLAKAMDGVEVIYHEAAAVGVGQSMYQIDNTWR